MLFGRIPVDVLLYGDLWYIVSWRHFKLKLFLFLSPKKEKNNLNTELESYALFLKFC